VRYRLRPGRGRSRLVPCTPRLSVPGAGLAAVSSREQPAQAAPRRLEPRGRLGLVATPLRLAPLHQLIQLVASVDVARLELEHTRELSDRRVIVAGAPFQARETEADARILGKQ